jgi:hypothetical protein
MESIDWHGLAEFVTAITGLILAAALVISRWRKRSRNPIENSGDDDSDVEDVRGILLQVQQAQENATNKVNARRYQDDGAH